MKVSDLSTMPIRIQVEQACQWVRATDTDADRLRMVTCARIYGIPEPGSRKKPQLLLGPIGVPGKPDATYSELLRCIADALEQQQEAEIVRA